MRRAFVWAVCVAMALSAAACTSGVTDPDGDVIVVDGTVRGTGVVLFYDFEGGFWAIRGDNDVTYDPIGGVPQAFQQHGLPVRFEGKLRKDLASVHMAGRMMELREIGER
ncbi:MAG TPA: hypothetical protein VJ812_13365 [Gemmatimonadaceae bacterium]|jgi:opacity protein-like surface antigen|nr:hypothetical protein [Gemmatimonadaceae bacterium]